MTKGHNTEDQQKKNTQKGAKTLNKKEAEEGVNPGRTANPYQAFKNTGHRKGLNDV